MATEHASKSAKSKLKFELIFAVFVILVLVFVLVFSTSGQTAQFAAAKSAQNWQQTETCGNLVCDASESHESCPRDCLPVAPVNSK